MADQEEYLPDASRVIATIDMAPPPGVAADLGPEAEAFTILRTDEQDEYEPQMPREILEATATASPVLSENFAGTDRKAAKISIAHGNVEVFDDLHALLDSLPSDDDMIDHDPAIPNDEHSDRVEEELRNVRVNAWLYAASREKDNDFHTIIGTDPAVAAKRFMNAEVSGLPSKKSAAFAKLKAARASFKEIVENNLPGFGYDFYKRPRPIVIEGSLFFDITHKSGGKPGPAKTKPATIWEIHPVTGLAKRKP
jgi:hypothetical protein